MVSCAKFWKHSIRNHHFLSQRHAIRAGCVQPAPPVHMMCIYASMGRICWLKCSVMIFSKAMQNASVCVHDVYGNGGAIVLAFKKPHGTKRLGILHCKQQTIIRATAQDTTLLMMQEIPTWLNVLHANLVRTCIALDSKDTAGNGEQKHLPGHHAALARNYNLVWSECQVMQGKYHSAKAMLNNSLCKHASKPKSN